MRFLGPVKDPAWRMVLVKIAVLDGLFVIAFFVPIGVATAGATVAGTIGAMLIVYVLVAAGAIRVARARWRTRG
jgi:hypothetical protein